jgi:integrase/recombinase XerD
MLTHSRLRTGHILAQRWFAQSGMETHAASYRQYLTKRGYSQNTIERYYRGLAHFAYWISEQGVGFREVDDALIGRFLFAHLLQCHCAPKCERSRISIHAAVTLFLEMRGIARARPISSVSTAIAREVADFDHHLSEVRGLSDSTRYVRRRDITEFLINRFGTGKISISNLTPSDVEHFVMSRTRGLAPSTIKGIGISLRSYFLFKASRGTQTTFLVAALPRVALWRLAGLPDILSPEEIRELLGAFDRNSATGMRDYAITRCLLDLGLRRTEVAQLCLDDIDWRVGTLTLHAKGNRVDVVPLPRRTGEAIAAYLQHGRPLTTRREVFVRHRPPLNAEVNVDIVRNAVRYAAERCGLQQRVRGTHIFRHTVACRMAQGGAPFKEIADLLRHRSLDTTTIYAKVNVPALRQVALPWPGRRS